MAQYTLVKRAVAAYHLDGPDEGAEPDRHKVTGNITFTPMLRPGEAVTMMEDNRPITLVPLPVEARISDGVIFHRGVEGVMLLAGGEKMNPDKLLWKAEFKHLQSNGKSFSLTPVVFEAVPGGEVDLSLVAPPPGKPVGTIRGRDGDTIEEMVHEGGELVLTIRHGDGKTSERRVDVRAVAEGVAGEALSDAREYAGTVADSMVRFEELGRQTAADRVSAGESAGAAGEAAEAAAGSAGEAEQSASSASSSAATAESHAKRAGSHANEAGSHASAAGESAKRASASAGAAAGDAGRAKQEADRATTQADKATESAGEAKGHADRAEGVVDTVRWDDDKLTVAGKTSPSLRGPRGQKGEPGDSGASTWDTITGKPDLVTEHEFIDLQTGISEAIEQKADKDHKHKVSDITDLPAITNQSTGGTLMKRDSTGRVNINPSSAPLYSYHVTHKKYVDDQDKATLAEARALVETRTVVKQVTSPPSTQEPGVLYVIPE
ncbi:hypothetical protein FYJ88_01155 [Corynebacterium urealyticum]|uniref:hypothetical protein n=1 Tax=Corynebacterium urealyticum TaxID=43771 RepID=UPI0011E75D3C|nr:hypothetical protein [Corynebacterium urealyticum]TYR17498.1 hypothetical protein FYJ88_01155 [Corynebacterium urealyticum]